MQVISEVNLDIQAHATGSAGIYSVWQNLLNAPFAPEDIIKN